MSTVALHELDRQIVRGETHHLPQELSDAIRVIGTREGGLVECYVPIGFINQEEVPVGHEYVISLASNMGENRRDGSTGQLVPVLLGSIEGETKLRIIDGFHRIAALASRGESEVYATIQPTDIDSLYDNRIFTAKDHKHVRFSRVVQWIRESWELTPMSEYFTVRQAIILYRMGTDGSRLKSGLVDEDLTDMVEQAKAWVARKEDLWKLKAMTINDDLMISESVAPSLVHATREKQSSHVLLAPTKQILKVFAKMIPYRDEVQDYIMGVAMHHNYKTAQVRALCGILGRCYTELDCIETAEGLALADIKPLSGETVQRAVRRASDLRHSTKPLETLELTVDRLVHRMNIAVVQDSELTPDTEEALKRASSRLSSLANNIGRVIGLIDTLLAPDVAEDNTPSDQADEKHLVTNLHGEGASAGSVHPKPVLDSRSTVLTDHTTPKDPTPQSVTGTRVTGATRVVTDTAPVVSKKPVPTQRPIPPAAPKDDDSGFGGRITFTPHELSQPSFSSELRDFLTGRINQLPHINSRARRTAAKRVLNDPDHLADFDPENVELILELIS